MPHLPLKSRTGSHFSWHGAQIGPHKCFIKCPLSYSHPSNTDLLPNRKWGLSAHHHSQANSGGKGLVRKGKVTFIQKLHNLRGWQLPASEPITSRAPKGKPYHPPARTVQGCTQSFFSHSKCHPLGITGGHCMVIQATNFFPHHCQALGSLLFSTAMDHVASRTSQSCVFSSQHIHTVGPRGTEHISPFPSFKSSDPNFHMLWKGPAPWTNPILFPG